VGALDQTGVIPLFPQLLQLAAERAVHTTEAHQLPVLLVAQAVAVAHPAEVLEVEVAELLDKVITAEPVLLAGAHLVMAVLAAVAVQALLVNPEPMEAAAVTG
jgi:hypothetical protein